MSFIRMAKKKKKKKGLAQAVIQIFCSQGSLKYEQCGAMIPQSNETKQCIEWKKIEFRVEKFEFRVENFELKTSSFESIFFV